jgi:hypothetical protein
VAFPLRTAEGSGYRRQRILAFTAYAGVAFQVLTIPSRSQCVGSRRQKGDVSAMEAKTPARRALAVLDTPPPAPTDPTGRRCLIPSG